MTNLMRVYYTGLACLLLLVACAMLLGKRDVDYLGDKGQNNTAAVIAAHPDWWNASVLLRRPSGSQWCSAVCVNNTGFINGQAVSWLVTARHCTDKRVGTASIVTYDHTTGKAIKELKFEVWYSLEHPTRDFAVLVVKGHMPYRVPVFAGELPTNRVDYIIGFRGLSHGDFYDFGKYVNTGWADKGQSGGGVFSAGLGLHSIVSTHVDGVNVYRALVDMKLTEMLNQADFSEEAERHFRNFGDLKEEQERRVPRDR